MIGYDPEAAVIGCAILDEHAGELFAELSENDFASESLSEVFAGLRRIWNKTGRLDGACVKSLGSEELVNVAIACCETVPSLSGWRIYAAASFTALA